MKGGRHHLGEFDVHLCRSQVLRLELPTDVSVDKLAETVFRDVQKGLGGEDIGKVFHQQGVVGTETLFHPFLANEVHEEVPIL